MELLSKSNSVYKKTSNSINMSTDEIINYYLLPITAAGIFWTTLVLTTRGGSIVCAALLFTVV